MTRQKQKRLFPLSVAALGVVYGDIGTSPLYALQSTLTQLPINITNVLGLLSLILWTLIIVISIKYLCIVLSVDNDGEGGVLVILALLLKNARKHTKKIYFTMGIFGAGLMIGDGMLTPAISVVSSVEGLKVISPLFAHWVLPCTVIILLMLFFFQSVGTAKIGFTFGPIILLWFLVIGILGVSQIIQNPIVLKAINPYFAVHFLLYSGWHGYAVLGGVFLVVTGGEALYADLGHFGKTPIRLCWFFIVLPGLLCNYFGQGAHLLVNPVAIKNPFYLIAPHWFLIPLVMIATVATIIASQAVISATFSLAKQAVLLGLYPRLSIIQTSELEKGQIYIPQVNTMLCIGTLIFVYIFKTSTALTHAYGVAVNGVMLLTTLMISIAAYQTGKINKIVLLFMFIIFILMDLLFLGSNIEKIPTGGWIPLVFAMICAIIMFTWEKGMDYLRNLNHARKENLLTTLHQMQLNNMNALPDFTAVFITDVYDQREGGLLDFLKLNHVLPKHILLLNYTVQNIPRVSSELRCELVCLSENVCKLTLHYGFMDFVSIPQALYVANDRGLLPFSFNIEQATYFIETPNIIASRDKKTLWFLWQEKLFSFLMRNYSSSMDIEFYQLPYHRTISIGTYCVI